jgi:hypothetical protein
MVEAILLLLSLPVLAGAIKNKNKNFYLSFL